MQKFEIRMLIVEDDTSLGRAIEEGLKRAGYNTKLVPSPAMAKQAIKLEEYHGMVIDCLLPKQNGVDLTAEILSDFPNMEIILTSGIYKDKTYAADALKKSKARMFMNKPFDMEILVKTFDDIFASRVDHLQEPLFQLFARDQYSRRDKLSAITATPNVHGFDLPWIYSLLMDSNITGKLDIKYADGKTAGIIFNKGKIVEVQYADTQSYFGLLLVEKGFATADEVQQLLKDRGNKKLGERLVDESFVSPHAIEIVQYEQMVIRISKTIQETSVEIRFTETSQPESDVFIDGLKFTQLMSDWICSKLTVEWLRPFYLPWLDSPLVPGADAAQMNIVKNLPAVKIFSELNLTLSWPHTMDELLREHPTHEDDLLRAIHFFTLQRVLRFGPKTSGLESDDDKLARLNRIWNEMKNQDYFEVLGLSRRAKPSEINRVYHELAKALHPDRIPPTSPAEIRNLSQQIFTKVTDAYDTLNNEARRLNYLKTLEHGLADEILEAESKFEEAVKNLQAHRFQDARRIFERLLKMTGKRTDTIVYYIWALVKERRHRSDRKALMAQVSDLMQTVAHEDRHSPQYFFVKGMYYELTGQVQKAYQTFKHVLSLDTNFIDAKKELMFIKQNYTGKSRSFSDDISVVVTKLFGRTKG